MHSACYWGYCQQNHVPFYFISHLEATPVANHCKKKRIILFIAKYLGLVYIGASESVAPTVAMCKARQNNDQVKSINLFIQWFIWLQFSALQFKVGRSTVQWYTVGEYAVQFVGQAPRGRVARQRGSCKETGVFGMKVCCIMRRS